MCGLPEKSGEIHVWPGSILVSNRCSDSSPMKNSCSESVSLITAICRGDMVMPCFDNSCIEAQENINKAEANNRNTLAMQNTLVSVGKLQKSKEKMQDNVFSSEIALNK